MTGVSIASAASISGAEDNQHLIRRVHVVSDSRPPANPIQTVC
jgi:hypothetical protein